MVLPRDFLEDYDEPFGFMDFASVGTLGRRSRARMHETIDFMSGHEGKLIPPFFDALDHTRQLGADLVSTTPDLVTFPPSTSDGLFSVAFGLRGGTVLVPSTDFPANLYPWMRAGEYGRITPQFVEAENGIVTTERLAASIDPSVTAVAISLVDYQTGYRVDLATLKEACGEALLIVDAVQGLGAIEVSMEHADVVVAGGQKWLRAGIGLAMMAVSPQAMDRLDPVLSGWLAVDDPFGLEPPAPHPVLTTAERYVSGSGPLMALSSLRGSLESLAKAPTADIESTVVERGLQVEEAVRSAGAELFSHLTDPSTRSGIVTFRLPDEPSTATEARVADAGFVITERNGWLRAAPHATTSPDAPGAFGKVLGGA